MGLDIQLGVKLPKNIGASINADIKKLKISELTIPVKIDTVSLKRVLKNLNVQFSKNNESKTLNISKNVFDVDKLQSDGRKFYISATDIVNRVKKDFSSMGKVNVTNIFKNAKGQIQGFSAELTKASGVVEKFNFEKAKLESANWNSVQSGFVQMNSVGADKLMGSDLEKKLTTLNQMSNRLADIQQKAFGLNKAVKQQDHVDTLNNKYQQIQSSIDKAKASGDAFSKDQARDLGNLIGEAERLRKTYQSIEYPATKLSAKQLDYTKSEKTAELTTLEKKWEKQGILVGEFQNKVLALKSTLSQVFDKTSLDAYIHDLKLLKEEANLFNASSSKSMSESSLETMNRNLPTMQSVIKGISADLSKILNVPQGLSNEVKGLTVQLRNINSLTDTQAKIEAYEKLQQSVNRVKKEITALGKEERSSASNADISDAQSKMSIWLNENTRAARKYREEIEDLNQKLENIKTPNELKAWNKEFTALKDKVQAAGDAGKSIFQSLLGKVKEFVAWTVSTMGVMAVVNTLRNMVQAVTDIDTAMTSLKKVTEETDNTYNQFLERASQNATKLGVKISELVDATAEFARTGYSLNESENLAQVATVYKNVGDEVTSISDSSEVLISIMRAFNLSAEDSWHIIDSLNEVGKMLPVITIYIKGWRHRSCSKDLFYKINILNDCGALVVT